MEGNPKHLNSKFDYEYVKNNCDPSYWRPAWQALIDNRRKWFTTTKLENKEAGKTDDTHRVQEITGAETTEYYQEEYMEYPNCDFVRFGFTEEEVTAALK